jgi:hypothetical protein
MPEAFSGCEKIVSKEKVYMLKVSIDNQAKPDVMLIIKGVLKGYFDEADDMLEVVQREIPAVAATLIAENPGYPAEFANLVSLVAALYSVIKRTEPEDRALSIVIAAFLPAGLAMQFGNFRFVEDERTFDHLVAYQRRTNREGPTRMNRMEVLRQDDAVYEFHVHNCAFHEAFAGLGFPELTAVMCAIDNVAFNAYLPDEVYFRREGKDRTIQRGNGYCSFICERRG